MPPVGFEPTISAGERPQAYALDRAATGTGDQGALDSKKKNSACHVLIAIHRYIIWVEKRVNIMTFSHMIVA